MSLNNKVMNDTYLAEMQRIIRQNLADLERDYGPFCKNGLGMLQQNAIADMMQEHEVQDSFFISIERAKLDGYDVKLHFYEMTHAMTLNSEKASRYSERLDDMFKDMKEQYPDRFGKTPHEIIVRDRTAKGSCAWTFDPYPVTYLDGRPREIEPLKDKKIVLDELRKMYPEKSPTKEITKDGGRALKESNSLSRKELNETHHQMTSNIKAIDEQSKAISRDQIIK